MPVKINMEGLDTPTSTVPEGNIPLGSGSFTPPKSQPSTPPIGAQASQMQSQNAPKTMQDIYGALMASKPTPTEIIQTVGKNTGLQDRISGARLQMQDIRRMMLSDQSHIFNATNPDGSPIDPRVKVAQYNANMKSYADRIDQLGQLENAYNSEISTIAKAEQDRLNAENEKNKIALQFLQQQDDQKWKEKQFNEQKYQFDVQTNKPVQSTDPYTGAITWTTPPSQGRSRGSGYMDEPLADTGALDGYGKPIQLKQSLVNPFQQAMQELKSQGIDLQIQDANRSEQAQKVAYDKWIAGGKKGPPVAPPGKSFHAEGQAFDLKQTKDMQNPIVKQTLEKYGFKSIPGEWWHYSVGEVNAPKGGSTQSSGITTQELLSQGMPKEIALSLDKEDLMALKGASPEEKKQAVDQLVARYKQDPKYFQTLRVKNIEKTLIDMGYSGDEVKKNIGTALLKNMNIAEVEKEFGKSAPKKSQSLDQYLSSLDTSKINANNAKQAVDNAMKQFPTKNRGDIIAGLKNVVGKEAKKELTIQEYKDIFSSTNYDAKGESGSGQNKVYLKEDISAMIDDLGEVTARKILENTGTIPKAGKGGKYKSGWIKDDPQYNIIQDAFSEKGFSL